MKQIASTENGFLHFNKEELKKDYRLPTDKIGWLHSKSNKPGARFDITIKDALGRVMLTKKNCGNDTDQYGELLNMPVQMGAGVTVELDNLKNAEEVDIFLN